METLTELRDQSVAALQYALDEHKTFNINLDMHAPLIIIPEEYVLRTLRSSFYDLIPSNFSICSEAGHCLILDAGNISVRSEVVTKSTAGIRREGNLARDREELMYDKYIVTLKSAQVSKVSTYCLSTLMPSLQVVLGNDLDGCLSALSASAQEGLNLHLIERTDMEFCIQSSIAPEISNLARFIVSGKLPSLAINVSDLKYKALMRLITIATPKLDDSSHLPTSEQPKTPIGPAKTTSGFLRKALEYRLERDGHSAVGDEAAACHEDNDNLAGVDAESEAKPVSRCGIPDIPY